MLQPGELIHGKYRILKQLADGGMGTIYEARHDVLGTTVALKMLHPNLAKRSNLAERFLQEARVSATLRSPHIVQVLDVEQGPQGAILVMELLRGETLQALLDRQTRLDLPVALDYTMQLLQGLEVAHEAGVVHRDLKPDNVFLVPGPSGPLLKLLDFGIAKLKTSPEFDRGLTRPGVVMGTPEYMAPEQAFSADTVDARADIYAMGVLLFEMLSGQRPVRGEEPKAIAHKVFSGHVTALSALLPSLPMGLVSAVHRAMAPSPQGRFASVAEMRQALLPFVQSSTSVLGPAGLPTPPAPTQPNPQPIPSSLHGPPTPPLPQAHSPAPPSLVAPSVPAPPPTGAPAPLWPQPPAHPSHPPHPFGPTQPRDPLPLAFAPTSQGSLHAGTAPAAPLQPATFLPDGPYGSPGGPHGTSGYSYGPPPVATSTDAVYGAPPGGTSAAPIYGVTSAAPIYGVTSAAPIYGATSAAPIYGATSTASVHGAPHGATAQGAIYTPQEFPTATPPLQPFVAPRMTPPRKGAPVGLIALLAVLAGGLAVVFVLLLRDRKNEDEHDASPRLPPTVPTVATAPTVTGQPTAPPGLPTMPPLQPIPGTQPGTQPSTPARPPTPRDAGADGATEGGTGPFSLPSALPLPMPSSLPPVPSGLPQIPSELPPLPTIPGLPGWQ